MKAFTGFLVLIFLCVLWFDEPEPQDTSIINDFPEPIGGLIDISDVAPPPAIITYYSKDSLLFHKELRQVDRMGIDSLPRFFTRAKAFKSFSGRTHVVPLPLDFDERRDEVFIHYCHSCKEPLTEL